MCVCVCVCVVESCDGQHFCYLCGFSERFPLAVSYDLRSLNGGSPTNTKLWHTPLSFNLHFGSFFTLATTYCLAAQTCLGDPVKWCC